MSETRYFEKSVGGAVRYWRISRDGIRCRTAWGSRGGRPRASSMTLDDEAQAERHFAAKIGEKMRQGYVEVAPPPAEDAADPVAASSGATLLDVMRASQEKGREGAWDAYWAGYEPVAGHDGVFVKVHDFRAGPGPFHHYLVLSEDARRGLYFIVKKPGHVAEHVSAFLGFVRPRLDLAFDGASHHKARLPAPVGRFDHVLFCAPSLCGDRYGGRLGSAFPILDCEIGDEDTETLVEARISGRDAMPWSTWDRAPFPVIDLRFDLRSGTGFRELGGRTSLREKTFKVYPRPMLDRAMRLLPQSDPGSRLEIRNYRGRVLALTAADLASGTTAEVDRFLHGPHFSPPPGR